MKHIIFLFAAAGLSRTGCLPPPPKPPIIDHNPTTTALNIQSIKSLNIQNLRIDSLIGLPSAEESDWAASFIGIDSLVIDLDNVPAADYEIKNGTLNMTGLKVPTIIVNPSNEPVTNKSPYLISKLRFKKIIVLRNGHQVELDTSAFYDQTKFHPTFYSLVNTDALQKRDQIKEKVKELEDRLELIRRKIAELMKKQPDHAADMLNPELDVIQKELIQIKEWHRNFTESLPVLNAALDKLFSINLTFDDMDYRVTNPQEAEIVNTKILFGSGEYKIGEKSQTQALDKIAQNICMRTLDLQKERPERSIVLKIKVSGYADQKGVGIDLKNELLAIPTDLKQGNLPEQDYLNMLLSEQRSLAVSDYLTRKVRDYSSNSDFMLKTESVGKGRESYPVHVPKGSCNDDCAERRVVVISEIAFSEK